MDKPATVPFAASDGQADAPTAAPDVATREYAGRAGWLGFALSVAFVLLGNVPLVGPLFRGWDGFFLSMFLASVALSLRWRREHTLDLGGCLAVGIGLSFVVPALLATVTAWPETGVGLWAALVLALLAWAVAWPLAAALKVGVAK